METPETSKTAKARATPHRPECPCPACLYRRRQAALPEPEISGDHALLAKRAEKLRRAIYLAQLRIDRAHRLLARLAPEKVPGGKGNPMQAILDALARGETGD